MSGDMASKFSTSVDYGLRLSKQTNYDEGAPPVLEKMSRSAPESYIPSAVMAYAVGVKPAVVRTSDEQSDQQSVPERYDPPALIPLHMHKVALKVDCCLDTAFVTVTGEWDMDCVKETARCDCLIAVPMGEQGTLLEVKVDFPGSGPGAGKPFYSQWVKVRDTKETGEVLNAGDGRFLKPCLDTFNIPQVEGGSKLSIKVSWSQKLLYQEDQFCLNVPFTFPAYVIPVGKKREKIVLNVNSGIDMEISCRCTSHSLKELSGKVRKGSFLYEAEVEAWSAADFNFSYTVSSTDMMGGVLLRSTKEMFCFYLFPGNKETRKVFRKEVVFIIDNSESMQEAPLGSVKTAVSASLSKLNPEDSFNLISFNGETCLFSSKMEQTTNGSISKATQWLENLTVDAGKNILNPIEQAMKLLANAKRSIPLIFLITDGTVEDERLFCDKMKGLFWDKMKGNMTSDGSISPRIYTFGIGPHRNHDFLHMLAQIGRGHYDWAYDADSIVSQIKRLFMKVSSIILANITIHMDGIKDGIELFPSDISDLSFENPLLVSGTYKGGVPVNIQVRGILADKDKPDFAIDLKVQNAEDMLLLDKIFARQQINALTAQAWFSGNKELEEKVATISSQTSSPSKYTSMDFSRAELAKEHCCMGIIRCFDLHHCSPVFAQICVVLTCFGRYEWTCPDCFECCYEFCCCCCD
ncbi:hypothetical protein SLA2020_158810 [Shorea laevis]